MTMTREERMEWALRIICDSGQCETVTSGIGGCERNGRQPKAEFSADQWCDSCLAYFALNGAFPQIIEARAIK